MPAPPAAVKAIFLDVVAVDDPVARAALLNDRCGADVELLARVNALLAANDRALGNAGTASFGAADGAGMPTAEFPKVEDAVPGEPTSDLPGRDEHVGAVLGGKYMLVEEIGEGGMGSVFMAQQTEPVKRAVAVKVIKAGMDSKAVLARFDAERQALAMMDHPNIARVLDAGTTAGGRPYFVMELVKGVPITQYCDEWKLTPRQRLELFVPVCNAIQHAHQKGVVHRDIKPSNVLVALYDDRPVPKVIDFGVAKAAGQSLTDKTLMTGFGAVVGTPEYMSPEQASLNNLDIDTRSDVYALGVLLYELLTGTTPVDRKSLGKAALFEILRIVREVEAPRPSSKLSTLDTLPRVAANRGTEPAKLSRLMRGELDWIAMKALEKDRARRYDTVNGFARDIQRYLADEVVEARPPGRGYRVRKFVKRNKGRVVAVAVVFVALVVGLVGTTSGLLWARTERDRAVAAEDGAREQARLVGQERDRVALERDEKQKAQGLERSARRAAQERVVRLHLRTGQMVTQQGDGFAGLHWLAAGREADADADDPARDAVHRVRVGAAVRALPTLQAVRFHTGPLANVRFSPDGRSVFSHTIDGSRVELWDPDTGRLKGPPLAHPAAVRGCGFSRDGARVFTTAADHAVRVWDAATGRAVGNPVRPAGRAELSAADLSPDGRTVLVAGRGTGRVELVEIGTGAVRRTWKVSADPASVRFSPSGTRFAAALEKTAGLWDLSRDEPLAEVPHCAEALHTAGAQIPNPSAPLLPAFTPDGRRMLTLRPGALGFAVWDAETGDSVGRPVDVRTTNDLVVSPTGRYVLATPNGADWTTAHVYDIESGRLVSRVEVPRNPTSGSFSPDGRTLLIRTSGSDVYLVDAATGRPTGPPMRACGRFILPQFNTDGTRVLLGEYDGIARVWRLQPTDPTVPYDPGLGGPADGYLITPDGSRRVASRGGALLVADRAGRPVGPPLKEVSAGAPVWLSPDGHRAAVRDPVRGFRVWAAETGEPSTPWFSPGRPDRRCWFGPDGLTLFTGCWEGDIARWDAGSGRPTGPPLRYDGAGRFVWHFALSPDGRRLAAGGSSNTAVVWPLTGDDKGVVVSHSGHVQGVAFSPDGRLLATASGDGIARAWDASTGRPAGPPLRAGGPMYSTAFSPDGRLLFTLSESGRVVHVWDWRTGDVVATLPAPPGPRPASVWFSRDGRRLALCRTADPADARAWSLDPFPLSKDDQTTYLELLTARRIDETEAVVPLLAGETQARVPDYRRVWAALHPELATPDPLEPAAQQIATSPRPPGEILSADGVGKRVGETCQVELRVRSVGRSNDRKWAYLNSHADHRHPDNVAVTIPSATPDRLREVGVPAELGELVGRTVVARGTIGTYQGHLQVLVGEGRSVWVLSP